jgi:ADP-heptose:LPS heptosyltransferase
MQKRILIVKFWALGDLLMATPILTALKKLFPGCLIDWLVDKDYFGILKENPLIDGVMPFDSGSWRRDYRKLRLVRYLKASFKIRREITSHRYDVVVCLSAEKWWSLWFAAAPQTIGLFPGASPNLLERFYGIAIRAPLNGIVHSTDHYLQVVKAMGGEGPFDRQLVYSVSKSDRETTSGFLASNSEFDKNKPIVLLNPGTSQESKCWPTQYFGKLADCLLPYANIVITGSPAERHLTAEVLAHSSHADRIIVAVGELPNVGHLGALVETASVVVTGDTAILHIASALDRPAVAIYGSTRPGINEPLFGKHVSIFQEAVPCAPCYKSKCPLKDGQHMLCQKSVAVEMVRNAAMKYLLTTSDQIK